MTSNDNDIAAMARSQTDPHGQAALLLVESLIHGLRERSILDIEGAIDIVETAVDVQADIVDMAGDARATMSRSHALLSAIAESLKRDRAAGNGHDADGYGADGNGADGEG